MAQKKKQRGRKQREQRNQENLPIVEHIFMYMPATDLVLNIERAYERLHKNKDIRMFPAVSIGDMQDSTNDSPNFPKTKENRRR